MSSFSRLLEHRYAPVLTGNGTEYLEFINSAAAHMEQLIDGILEYSRLTSSDHHGFEPLDLTRIINTVLTNLHVSIEETGASVTYDAMPTISGNPAQMIQVFQNLIGNAIKYRREGVHPRIHVAARQESDFWIFSVTDNGIGIDPKDRDSIFGVFQQLHGRSAGGAGIGLAVAKRIVEQHGGTIRVESDGDTGSRFLFSVPKLRSQR
jgi:signal transduction histidine kinase